MLCPTFVFQFPVRDFRLEKFSNKSFEIALKQDFVKTWWHGIFLLLRTTSFFGKNDSHERLVVCPDLEDVQVVLGVNEVLHGAVLVRHGHHARQVLNINIRLCFVCSPHYSYNEQFCEGSVALIDQGIQDLWTKLSEQIHSYTKKKRTCWSGNLSFNLLQSSRNLDFI